MPLVPTTESQGTNTNTIGTHGVAKAATGDDSLLSEPHIVKPAEPRAVPGS